MQIFEIRKLVLDIFESPVQKCRLSSSRNSFSMFAWLRSKMTIREIQRLVLDVFGAQDSSSKLVMFELQRLIFEVFVAQAQK